MTVSEWRELLEQWSKEIVSSELAEDLDPEEITAGWLGFPGATEEQIAAAERRLGTQLPPSYRAFLKVTNGWRKTTHFIECVFSVEEIVWYDTIAPHVLDYHKLDMPTTPDEEYFVYGEAQDPVTARDEYLATALYIAKGIDGETYLLNPKVISDVGEWEAWFEAYWLPGAKRYRSF